MLFTSCLLRARTLAFIAIGLLVASEFSYYHIVLDGFVHPPSEQQQRDILSAPQQILQRYQQEHSVDALHAELGRKDTAAVAASLSNRKYAVAYYSCPHRTGNMLHSFLNSVVWAVATNRTLLWAYDSVGAKNNQSDCDPYLMVNDKLIPAYDDWKERLQLPEPEAVKINTRWTDPAHLYTVQEQRESLQARVVIFPEIVDIKSPFNTPRILWREDILVLTKFTYKKAIRLRRRVLVEDPYTRRTLKQLYRNGRPYLLGMFFRAIFIIPDEANLKRYSNDDDDNNNNMNDRILSIAVHSRHPSKEDDGSDVTDETRCLQQLLDANQRKKKRRRCIVYVMADRQATLEQLKQWTAAHNCTFATAPKPDVPVAPISGWNPEHGPFGGGGFLHDLAFTSQARTALVGAPVYPAQPHGI